MELFVLKVKDRYSDGTQFKTVYIGNNEITMKALRIAIVASGDNDYVSEISKVVDGDTYDFAQRESKGEIKFILD